MLKLYLLRHGETPYSKTGGYCGNLDPELTPEGVQMAQEFATAYASLAWAAAYVSPMKRTIATAAPLCEKVGLTMNLRDGLKEISYGAWEGNTQEESQQQFPDDYTRWLAEPAWNAPTGGETGVQVATRASLVVGEIVATHASGNVLLVSHKATIRLILCSLLGIDLGRYRDRITALTGSVSVVSFGLHGPLLESLNDRSHLSPELRDRPGT
jgi:broad specificity phosphatase PhoE